MAAALPDVLQVLSADRLSDLLRRTRHPVSGSKPERARRLARALEDGAAPLVPDLLRKLTQAELRALAEAAGVAAGRRPELQRELAEWLAAETGVATSPGDEPAERWEADAEAEAHAEDPLSFDFDPVAARQPLWPFQQRVLAQLRARAEPASAARKLVVPIATGGGKTRIANDWIWRHVLPRGRRLLWVTKDWELLRQSSSDIARRHPGGVARLGRIGGGSNLRELPERLDADVTYTTIHTFYKRRKNFHKLGRIDYVVIDEVHWGEGGTLYGGLEQQYPRATFVGLTATPRQWSDYEPVCRPYGLMDLVHLHFLARPKFQEVRTRMRWAAERVGDFGDFTAGSLAYLAKSPRRNDLIAGTYARDRRRFGKTLVFAVDIGHALQLASLFQDRGVPARALHSKLDYRRRRQILRSFRAPAGSPKAIEVLVNVAMMTHGVDIPDIGSIFLARPTASRTLFSQMIGRGARRIPGRKESFWIVDFVDNLTQHGDVLVRSHEVIRAGEAA